MTEKSEGCSIISEQQRETEPTLSTPVKCSSKLKALIQHIITEVYTPFTQMKTDVIYYRTLSVFGFAHVTFAKNKNVQNSPKIF